MTNQDKSRSQKSTDHPGLLSSDSIKKAIEENFEKHIQEKISFISAQLIE